MVPDSAATAVAEVSDCGDLLLFGAYMRNLDYSSMNQTAGSRMKSNAAKESELDNPAFLHFKCHDFTHCVSDHLNILVVHPDRSQTLKRP